jgi:hypothetical protein
MVKKLIFLSNDSLGACFHWKLNLSMKQARNEKRVDELFFQTSLETENRDIQVGPSTFTDFKEVGCSSFLRKVDVEVQVESRIKHATTQTKLKVKEMGIQNTLIRSLQVETETQVDHDERDDATQTDLLQVDQFIQATEAMQIRDTQTDVVEFLELKAVLELGTQTEVLMHSRKAQTHLSSTMKDPETYMKQKEVALFAVKP